MRQISIYILVLFLFGCKTISIKDHPIDPIKVSELIDSRNSAIKVNFWGMSLLSAVIVGIIGIFFFASWMSKRKAKHQEEKKSQD
tara:strand:- start:63 stop:317 length:255 start_codon:yes stop_codon:yes gene_type:complete